MNHHHFIFISVTLLIAYSLVDGAKSKKVTNTSNGPKVKANTTETGSREDPCGKLKCGPGTHCRIDPKTREARCECISQCSVNKDPRRQVCSNYNQTWESDCHLFKRKCQCDYGLSKECTKDEKHMHINYYGGCKQLNDCDKDTLADFPRRMREWLYNIMKKKYPKPLEMETDQHHGWVNAIIWKFCDLDKEPHDRKVSRHELFPLRAPLLSMEPCIAKFLDSCDPDGDHKVTLIEWGKCLEVAQAEMEDKCQEFNQIS
ncbi:secreted protein, acidic, cysteine-rich [Brevipalpus obovatus]|uniref:secreted protein, acidic, cysteine-rich n=1 Tax=Brevipalpus obovatus TaxID=246614 RepID=UPI003D9E39DF